MWQRRALDERATNRSRRQQSFAARCHNQPKGNGDTREPLWKSDIHPYRRPNDTVRFQRFYHT
jgi:hypothetical protein